MARQETLGPEYIDLLDQFERAEVERASEVTNRAADALMRLLNAHLALVSLLGPDKTRMILTTLIGQLPPRKAGAKSGPRDAKAAAELLAIYDREVAQVAEEDRKRVPRIVAKRLIAAGRRGSVDALRKQIERLRDERQQSVERGLAKLLAISRMPSPFDAVDASQDKITGANSVPGQIPLRK